MADAAGVDGRITAAQKDARASEAEVNALSAQRLQALKALPPARLMRLGRDPELTDEDQKELQNFVANRARPAASSGKTHSSIGRLNRMKSKEFGARPVMVVAIGFLALVALVIGTFRTPSEIEVAQGDLTIAIGDATGPLERVLLKTGTVVRLGPPSSDMRTREISYWVPMTGYRTAIYYPDPPAQ
ncbi:MAG: hypothetical protein V7704_14975 [Aurantimonas endophytica]|uniref:hypothetical protein n=1 Tax=Aurantimonas endophytica TaxID=1522175 RepID=UPI003002A8AB